MDAHAMQHNAIYDNKTAVLAAAQPRRGVSLARLRIIESYLTVTKQHSILKDRVR